MTIGAAWARPQQQLVELIFDAFSSTGEWPVYQWLEAEMWQRGLGADDVIRSFPVDGGTWTHGLRYSDLWFDSALPLRPDQRVRLRVRALARLDAAEPLMELFTATLRKAAAVRSAATFGPNEVVEVRVTNEDVVAELGEAAQQNLVVAVYDLLQNEPLWNQGLGSRGTQQDGSWWIEVGPEIFQFVDATIESYLAWIDGLFTRPPQVPAPRTVVTPLDVATWLTYLDTTWRVHSSRPLVQVTDFTGLTGLAFDVSSAEEFTARCATLGDILKSLQAPSAPGVAGHALDRLNAYLESRLVDEDRGELAAAIEVLNQVRVVRNAGAHGSAAARGQLALSELGVQGPPYDWSHAWDVVRAQAATALMDLRNVVDRLPPRSDRMMHPTGRQGLG